MDLTLDSVCKTCTDYGHTCLGYNEPDKPQSQAQTTSQESTKQLPTVHLEDEDQKLSPVRSPGTPRAPAPSSIGPQKSPKANKASEAPLPLTRDTLSKAVKDQEKGLPVESPESSMSSSTPLGYRDSYDSAVRSHVSQLQQSHACSIFQILWSDGHRSRFQTDGTTRIALEQLGDTRTDRIPGGARSRWKEEQPIAIIRYSPPPITMALSLPY